MTPTPMRVELINGAWYIYRAEYIVAGPYPSEASALQGIVKFS